MNKGLIKTYVRGIYDLQKLRVEMGNRLCAQFRSKLGLEPGQKEEDDKEAEVVLDSIRVSYKKLTDGVKSELTSRTFKGDGVISDWAEFNLIRCYMDIEKREDQLFRSLESILKGIPIYDQFLVNVRGCGPAMSGVIISELDPHKARNISSFWKYAGLDVVIPTETIKEGGKIVCEAGIGQGRSRKAHHLIKKSYIDSEGKEQERNSITFNPWLKTKLYVLATCFVKSGGKYREIYDGYKFRLQNSPRWASESKGHINNAAMRYMVKMFLSDLWVEWRKIENLPVTEPYAVAKLGMRPHGQNGNEKAA